jgi:hypothetical protein
MAADAARAGERDSHLTATHFIARYVDLDEREAAIIASATYSIDVNALTQPVFNPLPPPSKTMDGTDFTSPRDIAFNATMAITKRSQQAMEENARRIVRDQVSHSLNKSPEAVVEQLERMKGAVEQAHGDQQLYFMGEYLHALQDAYFHQYREGDVVKPFNSMFGHYDPLQRQEQQNKDSWPHGKFPPPDPDRNHPVWGPAVDSVRTHFDAAARSYIATKATLIAMRNARRTGEALILPDPKQLAIYGEQGLGAEGLVHDRGGDMLQLAHAIAASYKDDAEKPDHAQLDKNLTELWGRLSPDRNLSDRSYTPALKLKGETDVRSQPPKEGLDKADFDHHPELLMDPIRNAVIRQPDGRIVTAGAAAPGGISLTTAAAAGMPITIDLDAIRYDAANNSVVLSGSSTGEPQVFDAAIFLTTLRLACTQDPYFSLDPPNAADYAAQERDAFKVLEGTLTALTAPLADAELQKVTSVSYGNFELRGPVFVSASLSDRAQQKYNDIMQRYPALRPILVFRPDWLRQTRVGKILYDADVVLKELSTGERALGQDQTAPGVSQVPGYVSAVEGGAARRLLLGTRWRPPAPGTQNPKGALELRNTRLWFDLAGASSARGDPAVEQPPPGWHPSPPQLLQAASLMEENFKKQDILRPATANADADAAQLVDSASVRDLSRVFPRMYIRRTENGVDVPGSDPDDDRLAADVNRRFPEYMKQYPELRRLVEVFRAYVASRKIVEGSQRACAGLRIEDFPLFPAERVADPLPDRHPIPLWSFHLARADIKYTDSAGTTWTLPAQGGVTSYSGGVALSYSKMKSSETAKSEPEQRRIDALVPPKAPDDLVWQGGDDKAPADRTAIALAIDGADLLAIRNFMPVTAEAVIANLDSQLDEVIKKLKTTGAGGGDDDDALKAAVERLKIYLYALTAAFVLALAAAGYGLMRRRSPVATGRVPGTAPAPRPSQPPPSPTLAPSTPQPPSPQPSSKPQPSGKAGDEWWK